jgi:uncharacterized protein YyaL (SSP411 family)
MADWLRRAAHPYAPRRITIAIPETAVELPGHLAARRPMGDALAYVCSGLSCGPAVTDLEEFNTLLTETEIPRTP